MTEERKVIKQFKSFVLGFCRCGCSTEISIRRTDGLLKIYEHGHNAYREGNPNWKGGIGKWGGNYLSILRPHHKYADPQGRVALHRYRMELILGRYLTKEEVVHHFDGDPYNNEESNLTLFEDNGKHISETMTIHTGNTLCLLCKSNQTTFKTIKGKIWYNWYSYNNGHICNHCYYLINKEKYMERQRRYRKNKKKI